MAMKHRITINVTDPNGKKAAVLRGADMKLPARLVRFLFVDFQQVYLLSPGPLWMTHTEKKRIRRSPWKSCSVTECAILSRKQVYIFRRVRSRRLSAVSPGM